MKKGQSGKVKAGLIVIICILIFAVLVLFGIMAWQLFHADKQKKQPQYVAPQATGNQIGNQTTGDGLLVLEKLAKPFTYCTDPDCKIKTEDHLHFGDRIAYDPTKLKDGVEESALTYTVFSLNTGSEIPSVTFDARTTDKISEWYVIGEENGHLMLLAGTTTGNNLELKGAIGVINSAYEMDKICGIYGNGIGAESATALTLEKLNELAGITANLDAKTVTYRDESPVEYLFNYGNEVDYSKNRTKNNQNEQVDPWTKEGQVIPTYITQYITNKSPLKVKSAYYGYSLANTKVVGNDARLAQIKLGLNKDIWLATIGMNADENNVRYGPAGVAANNIVVSAIDLFSSDGIENKGSFPVRPVVTLVSNVNTGMMEKIMD